MIFRPALCVACSVALALAGCGPGFQSNVTPIKNPTSYKASYQSDGFQIGFDVLTTQEQVAQFGVDMTKADVVPIRVVARNDGNDELYVQEDQIFGKTDGGDLYPAYRLDQSIDRICNSEVGKAMASGAAMGLIIGAAIGAAAGAAISSSAGGNAGQGAAVGAAVGGTGGGLSGAAAAGDFHLAEDQERAPQGRLGRPGGLPRPYRIRLRIHETGRGLSGARSFALRRQQAAEQPDQHSAQLNG